jgi:hypothetical protein
MSYGTLNYRTSKAWAAILLPSTTLVYWFDLDEAAAKIPMRVRLSLGSLLEIHLQIQNHYGGNGPQVERAQPYRYQGSVTTCLTQGSSEGSWSHKDRIQVQRIHVCQATVAPTLHDLRYHVVASVS